MGHASGPAAFSTPGSGVDENEKRSRNRSSAFGKIFIV
jgi:hypothetical protein